MKTKNTNLEQVVASSSSSAVKQRSTLSDEIRMIESQGYVAVGQPYDGSQTYIDMRSDRPVLTQIPYEERS